jgi:hypothetical protein
MQERNNADFLSYNIYLTGWDESQVRTRVQVSGPSQMCPELADFSSDIGVLHVLFFPRAVKGVK